jgi:hypothetical protein
VTGRGAETSHQRPPKATKGHQGHRRPTSLSGAHLRFLQSWKASYTGDGGPCIKITLGSAPCQQYGIIAQHECSETAKCPHGPMSLPASTPIYCGAVPPPVLSSPSARPLTSLYASKTSTLPLFPRMRQISSAALGRQAMSHLAAARHPFSLLGLPLLCFCPQYYQLA